jgi:hypothetical protein
MAPNNYKPVREKYEQKTWPSFLYQMKKMKRHDEENENELQKLMFSRVGRSENEIQKLMFSRVGRSENELQKMMFSRVGRSVPMFLTQMKKIKREDEDNENELHRLMYSRVG